MRRVGLLGISGSIRRDSHCTAVLRTLGEVVAAEVDMPIFPLADLPPYNEDDDQGEPPEEVAKLRAAIRDSQGLVVISPEYNHGISGVLKNAIDWASRPTDDCALVDKPVLIMTSATSPLGGVRAQAQLRESFAATHSRVIADRQVVIGNVAQKIQAGQLVDQATLEFVQRAINLLLAEIRMLEQGCTRRD